MADRASNERSLRLLECWLPLAQELNEAQGWGDDTAALETLVLAATPALAAALDTTAARVILMLYHAVLRTERP